MIPILTGCQATPSGGRAAVPGDSVQRTYTLRHADIARCRVALELLDLAQAEHAADANALVLTGTPDQLDRADLVLDVMDCREEYSVERLGPASNARTLPSNGQIAAALGDITIGTFSRPPAGDVRSRAIIDIYGDSVLAIVPLRCRTRLHRLLADGDGALSRSGPAGRVPESGGSAMPAVLRSSTTKTAAESNDAGAADATQSETVVTLADMTLPADPNAGNGIAEHPPDDVKDGNEPPKTVTITFAAAGRDADDAPARTVSGTALPPHGEDVLTMTLPETITLIQLLDLVGKHVGLDYVYDPKEIPNQPVALKLHGELRGEMKVKHLYALMETVLDFMGLAMIRQQENFMAVVPIDKALQTQPRFVEGDSEGVRIGDTVVTRVFEIRHVEVASVVTLLQSMKLSVAATPLDGGSLLLVTCHAGRMSRIEQLVALIDRPGRPAECRFRRLGYVRATPLIAKIRALAGELEGIAVATPAPAARPSAPPAPAAAKPAATPRPAAPAAATVYLDTDERTNRILMIGLAEELAVLEQLIDVLDVAQEDPRSPHLYAVRHLNAQQVLDKLQKLEVLQGSSGPAAAGAGDEALTGEPLVAVLETTNQLLVKAAPDQHARIREFLAYIDTQPTDTRTIAAYPIRHIDVHTAQETLEKLDLVSVEAGSSSFLAGPNQPSAGPSASVPIAQPAGNPLQKAPIVVSESTQALLVKATAEQHARIEAILRYIDRYTPAEQWSYQVYPLESSSPDHLAGLLERLIQETTREKDGKIEKIAPRTAEQITIVPDPNTFSLIVYASQKNQKWIETLIGRLDKRRPQVLIDVTLVEITRTDSFEYDLNLVASAHNAVTGNLVIDPIQRIDSGSRLEGGFNLLDQDGNPTGRTRAFYSDEHVQALLTAIQRKNYGRVLAKPKVLVDDGRKGQIMTTDTTTYVKESIQIPQTGTPITTREFVPIEASIELQITPHISEGNLLRLDVYMSRDDFGARPASGAPPDKATSEVTTAVFVPDDRTVILGGLVKLNQSKGGARVPILGDLPLLGLAFRSIDNSDIEKKLYVFLKANIVRPYDDAGLLDLQEISAEHREAFEQSESEFQQLESIPGIPSEPMPPDGVLREYK